MGINDLGQRDFELSGIKFRIEKMNAFDGFNVLEKVRFAVGETIGGLPSFSGENSEANGKAMIAVIMGIRPDHLADIFQDCLEHSSVCMSGDSYISAVSARAAIEGIDPLDIYELIARFLAVNFMKSFRSLLSRLGLEVERQETTPQ
jgi:hypothetical protein